MQILKDVGRRFDANDDRGPSLGGRMLRILIDHDELESRGASKQGALDSMRERHGVYDPQLLNAYARGLGLNHEDQEVVEVRLSDLREGMTFADDVRHRGGTLLIARGYMVTRALLERFAHLKGGQVREPLRVILESSPPGTLELT